LYPAEGPIDEARAEELEPCVAGNGWFGPLAALFGPEVDNGSNDDDKNDEEIDVAFYPNGR
jgi:hypothetical protein